MEQKKKGMVMHMKQLALLLLITAVLMGGCAQGGAAGGPGADTTAPAATTLPPPDPKEDYTAYYDYLLKMQSAGQIPFEDKLVAGGEVVDLFELTIGGKAFTNAEAQGLTIYTATFEQFTKVEGHVHTWVGYRFTEVCQLLGLELGQSVKLHAADGYSQVFDVKNIDDNTMLAITKNGDPSDGPYFAPCTYLISAGYTKLLSEIGIP